MSVSHAVSQFVANRSVDKYCKQLEPQVKLPKQGHVISEGGESQCVTNELKRYVTIS